MSTVFLKTSSIEKRPTSSATGGSTNQLEMSTKGEEYAQWRERFSRERIRYIYYICSIANLFFVISDFYLYREHWESLLLLRIMIGLGWLGGLLVLKYGTRFPRPYQHLIVTMFFTNIGLSGMTVVLGGFTSAYYHGLNLVFFGMAVVLPAWWIAHLIGQVSSLLFYYGINLSYPLIRADINAGIENSFFLISTCVIALVSVYLYEQLQQAEFSARQAEGHARRELECSNKKLEESNQKLLELDRLKNEFFANISHELRTPLTLILGGFKSLLHRDSQVNSQEIIQAGLRNSGRLLFLINELLDLAKFESGRPALHKQSFDYVALIRSVAAQFESSYTRRIHLRGCTEPVVIEADAKQLKKVLTNLLANAFKFNEAPEPQVWLRLNAQDGWVELEVEDNGIGIPRKHLPHIFDRFTQVEGSATRRYEGSGIGLALVKEIVTAHGGRIQVESEPDRGSTFMVTLPRGNPSSPEDISGMEGEGTFLVKSLPDALETAPSNLPASLIKPNSPLILVVDDNPDMRRYLVRILSTQYRVAVAKDGAEGLEQAQTLKPALILTDMMMPHMSGYDLLKAVRQTEGLRYTPIIFLTARAGAEARIESLESGANDYIPKPFDEQEVLARVNNLLQLRQQERNLRELQQEKLRGFLPSHLGEVLFSEEGEEFLKPHRANVTVLFIDLRGFTAFAGKAEPENVMEVLQEYHSEMGKLILSYHGTIERLIGDAIMAFLNDPSPQPNHIEQGVRLALAMLMRMENLSQKWRKRGFELGAGVGLASGFATLGVIGSEGRKEYTATGPVTNLAARLCSEAQSGQLLISEQSLAQVEALVKAEPVGPLNLKGYQQPVKAYHVTELKGEMSG